MDTKVIRDRENEYIHVTLGPKGHELSNIELLRIVAGIKKDMESSKGDTHFKENLDQRETQDWLDSLLER